MTSTVPNQTNLQPNLSNKPTKQDTKVVIKKKNTKLAQQKDDFIRYKSMGFFSGFLGGADIKQRIKKLRQQQNQNPQGKDNDKTVQNNGQGWIDKQKKQKQGEKIISKKQGEKVQFVHEEQVIFIEPSITEKDLQILKQKMLKFTDQYFYPNSRSLCGLSGFVIQWQDIYWQRISNAFKNPCIVQGIIEPSDIKQGYLGDCYFLAGLAALAQYPNRVDQLFLTHEIDSTFHFSVKILFRGKWRTIDLDDYFPFAYNQPAFSRSQKNQLWVMILEKAWAKLYGSYKRLQSGFPQQSLHDLTGAPIKIIFLKRFDSQNQWQYLLQASKKTYSMVATSNRGSDAQMSQNGIFLGHSYTLLHAYQVSLKGQLHKIIKLRNPWGNREFKGKWSDKDSVWNQISKQQKIRLGYINNSQDGVFFISFKDFRSEFNHIAVAQINDNASYIYQSIIDHNTKGAYFLIQIEHQATYSLQIDKTPQRYFPIQQQSRYRYPYAYLQFGKIQNNDILQTQSTSSKKRCLFQNFDLSPGKYVAYVKVDFDPQFQKDYQIVLAIYAEYACHISIANKQQAKMLHGNQCQFWQYTRETITKEQITANVETHQKQTTITYDSKINDQVQKQVQKVHQKVEVKQQQYSLQNQNIDQKVMQLPCNKSKQSENNQQKTNIQTIQTKNQLNRQDTKLLSVDIQSKQLTQQIQQTKINSQNIQTQVKQGFILNKDTENAIINQKQTTKQRINDDSNIIIQNTKESETNKHQSLKKQLKIPLAQNQQSNTKKQLQQYISPIRTIKLQDSPPTQKIQKHQQDQHTIIKRSPKSPKSSKSSPRSPKFSRSKHQRTQQQSQLAFIMGKLKQMNCDPTDCNNKQFEDDAKFVLGKERVQNTGKLQNLSIDDILRFHRI